VKLERFDHLVLTVRSIAATSFYRDGLGMEVVTFGEGRIALGFGIQKTNLHEVGREGRLVAARPTSGSGDLCFITTRPLPEWTERLRAACVRAVDFEAGRRLCTPDLIAFGIVAHFVEGIDRVTEQQRRSVWPNIRDFTIRTDAAPGIHSACGPTARPSHGPVA
jgi:catechol 2,3-dioxygenase-like lactoylglutathione lyase family enzyme